MGQASSSADPAVGVLRDAYLARIGFSEPEITALLLSGPSLENLRLLSEKHINSVPFENLSLHEHPAEGEETRIAKDVPVLDVGTSLKKIVIRRRGGFCFEINFAFAWLLRTLGFTVRLCNAQVLGPQGPSPGHCCLIVELPDGPYLVDPGFGDGIREPVPMTSKTTNEAVEDRTLGDSYSVKATSEYGPKFNSLFLRGKKHGNATLVFDFSGAPSPGPEPVELKPQYIFNDAHDLAMDSEEFRDGIAHVTSNESIFTKNRICSLGTPTGNITIGRDYIKRIENGAEVFRQELSTQAATRKALRDHFGVDLVPSVGAKPQSQAP